MKSIGIILFSKGYFATDILLYFGEPLRDDLLCSFVGFGGLICGGTVKSVFCASPIWGFKGINSVLITAASSVFIDPSRNNIYVGKSYFVAVFSETPCKQE